tara:strand:- start:3533 stop:3832 length:300 start_codon:yes stop_codon:yes gene_type:complete
MNILSKTDEPNITIDITEDFFDCPIYKSLKELTSKHKLVTQYENIIEQEWKSGYIEAGGHVYEMPMLDDEFLPDTLTINDVTEEFRIDFAHMLLTEGAE